MEQVFLIGGSGFIGKHIVQKWYHQYDLVVIDRYIDEAFFVNYPDVVCYKWDITKEIIPNEWGNPQYVINLASTMVTADRDLSNVGTLIKDNLDIISRLYERLKWNKELRLLVQFGTIEEYGPTCPPLCEVMREYPNSAYSLMKQTCTNYTLMLAKNEGFPACVVRPANLFGVGQNPQRFVPYVLGQLKMNQPVNVTPCEQKRDFLHVDDFVQLLHRVLQKSNVFVGEVVNLSSGKSICLKDIIETMRKEVGSTSVIHYGAIPYRDGEVMDLCCDNSKLMSLLGEQIEIDTISKLIQYAKD